MIERVLGPPARPRRRRAPCCPSATCHDAFAALFPDGRCGGVRRHATPSSRSRSTPPAPSASRRVAAGIDERFLVVNGDVLTDLDVTALLDVPRRRDGAEATIALAHVDDPSAFGLVVTDGADGRVERFVEKPPAGAGRSRPRQRRHLRASSPRCSTASPAGRRVSIEREVFPGHGRRRAPCTPSRPPPTGPTPARPPQYLQAQLDLVAGRRPGPPAPGAVDRRRRRVDRWATADVDGDVRGPGPRRRRRPGGGRRRRWRNSVVGAGRRRRRRGACRRLGAAARRRG